MSFLSAARIGIDTEGIMSKKRASLNFTPAPIPSPTPIHEATGVTAVAVKFWVFYQILQRYVNL